MDSPGAGGRRRGTTRVSAEDQALDQIAKEVSNQLLFLTLIYFSLSHTICKIFTSFTFGAFLHWNLDY